MRVKQIDTIFFGIIAAQIDFMKNSNPSPFELFEFDKKHGIESLLKRPYSFSKYVILTLDLNIGTMFGRSGAVRYVFLVYLLP